MPVVLLTMPFALPIALVSMPIPFSPVPFVLSLPQSSVMPILLFYSPLPRLRDLPIFSFSYLLLFSLDYYINNKNNNDSSQ